MRFWKGEVQKKERKDWQLVQWAAAVRWYLRWLEICRERGAEACSLPERMHRAVMNAGARRGLAWNTRKTYAGWAARYQKEQGP